ncbi:MAG: hypothetical protein Q9219_005404 [cf. Caloplaca sp. 3 TL-2023]
MALLARLRSPLAKPNFTFPVRTRIQIGGTRQLNLQSYLVTPKELSEALKANAPSKTSTSSRTVPLCATWFLPNDPKGRSGWGCFQAERVPSARFFDLDVVKDRESPYPHMLPSAENFARAMQKIGIRKEDQIVVYDSQEIGIFSAPRVAWTLKVFGHPDVHILNNFKLWVEQGYPTEKGEPEAIAEEPSRYPIPEVDSFKVVDFPEMTEIVKNQGKKGTGDIQVVDARSKGRWAGTDPEPRPGFPNGHMPGSVNVPFSELLDRENGAFLSGPELRRIFESKGLDPNKTVINSCGTGVTAAVVDAALGQANFGHHGKRRLYDGSWT